MDEQVKLGQQWLNATYGRADGWVPVAEDGRTGWDTMFALRRGLQVELGVAPLGAGFGPATAAAYAAKVGRITSSTPDGNLVRLLSVALWCKGYPGLFPEMPAKFSALESSVLSVLHDAGLNTQGSIGVDVKLMKSLLSMDAYVKVMRGKDRVRDIQRWLNGTYISRADFDIVPCEGIYSRQVQTAMLFALQYEIGMADGVANGNFGPGTRRGIREKAEVKPGTSGNLTRLFQAALIANDEDCPFNGTFDADTATATRSFQEFLELERSGIGDYGTWCALLVSTGDAERTTNAFDTARSLSPEAAKTAAGRGYRAVGRYLVGGGKYLRPQEMDALREAGLSLIPIFQRHARDVTDFTKETGRTHAEEAFMRARLQQIPEDSLIVFAVDVDLTGEEIAGPLVDYFSAIKAYADDLPILTYKIGVYGTRNVCATLKDKGLTSGSYVSGMSSGWSGNMGFAMPRDWMYNQIAEVESGIEGVGTLDKVAMSTRARPVAASQLLRVPTAAEPSDTSLVFDEFYELVVRAEQEVARFVPTPAAGETLPPPAAFRPMIPTVVAHWLRKPKYWSAGKSGELWQLYTPITDNTGMGAWGEATSQQLAKSFGDQSQRFADWEKKYDLDAQHLAATFLGYERWGLAARFDELSTGDLGGWLFDLLSVWGDAERAGKTSLNQLEEFVRQSIGGDAKASSFSKSDLIADAGAYLLVKWLRQEQGSTLGRQVARMRRLSTPEVLSQFWTTRFDGRIDLCQAAFEKFTDLMASPFVKGSMDALVKDAAHCSTMPGAEQLTVLGRAFAVRLRELSQ